MYREMMNHFTPDSDTWRGPGLARVCILLMLGVKPSLRFCKKWKYKNPCFFWPLTWIYGLRPPALKFMGCILKWGGDSEGALNNQKGYKQNWTCLKKYIVPCVASNLRLDNAFINDTNVFCPRRLRHEKVSKNIQQYSVQPHIAFEA